MSRRSLRGRLLKSSMSKQRRLQRDLHPVAGRRKGQKERRWMLLYSRHIPTPRRLQLSQEKIEEKKQKRTERRALRSKNFSEGKTRGRLKDFNLYRFEYEFAEKDGILEVVSIKKILKGGEK